MKDLSYEDHILGGSASDALDHIRKTEVMDNLNALLAYEQKRMNRRSVVKALKRKIRKAMVMQETMS